MFDLLFGTTKRVTRGAYLRWGLLLAFIKYLGEMGLFYATSGEILAPTRFLSPLYSSRQPFLAELSTYQAGALMVWTLLFIWIGMSMTMRRAWDAGLQPTLSFLFFFPILNFILIAILAVLPTKRSADVPHIAVDENLKEKERLLPLTLKVGAESVFLSVLLLVISVYYLEDYGIGLFFGTPFLIGVIAKLESVRGGYTEDRVSWAVASGAVSIVAFALLLFALEGVLCIVMALPFAIAAAFIGTMLGSIIAMRTTGRTQSVAFPAILILIAGIYIPIGRRVRSRNGR